MNTSVFKCVQTDHLIRLVCSVAADDDTPLDYGHGLHRVETMVYSAKAPPIVEVSEIVNLYRWRYDCFRNGDI